MNEWSDLRAHNSQAALSYTGGAEFPIQHLQLPNPPREPAELKVPKFQFKSQVVPAAWESLLGASLVETASRANQAKSGPAEALGSSGSAEPAEAVGEQWSQRSRSDRSRTNWDLRNELGTAVIRDGQTMPAEKSNPVRPLARPVRR